MATPTQAPTTTPAGHAPVNLPATGFLRLSQIVGNPKTNPPILPIIPISKSALWDKVKTGQFPKPVKLGLRVTAWRVEDLRQWIAERGSEVAA